MEHSLVMPADGVTDDDLKQCILDYLGWNQQESQDKLSGHMAKLGISSQFVTAHVISGWLMMVFTIHMPGFIGVDKARREFSTIAKACRMSIPYAKLARTGRGGAIEGEIAFQIPVPKNADLLFDLHALSDIYAIEKKQRSVHRDR